MKIGNASLNNKPQAYVEKIFSTVALEVNQNSLGYHLYVFIADGKEMAKQVGVRRMKWHKGKFKAEGFQRALDFPLCHFIRLTPTCFAISFPSARRLCSKIWTFDC